MRARVCVWIPPPPLALKTQTMGASRLRPCCLKWGSVVLIELNEWCRTPLHLSDPAAPALPPSQIPAPTPDAPAPSKEQLANGWPIKQARATSPHLCSALVAAEIECVAQAAGAGGGCGGGESHVAVEKRCVCVCVLIRLRDCVRAGSYLHNSAAMTLALLVARTAASSLHFPCSHRGVFSSPSTL